MLYVPHINFLILFYFWCHYLYTSPPRSRKYLWTHLHSLMTSNLPTCYPFSPTVPLSLIKMFSINLFHVARGTATTPHFRSTTLWTSTKKLSMSSTARQEKTMKVGIQLSSKVFGIALNNFIQGLRLWPTQLPSVSKTKTISTVPIPSKSQTMKTNTKLIKWRAIIPTSGPKTYYNFTEK